MKMLKFIREHKEGVFVGILSFILVCLISGLVVNAVYHETKEKKYFETLTPQQQQEYLANKEAEEEAGIAFLPEITFDEFTKIDLRVAEVVACEPIKKAKKLLKLTLNDGSKTPRTGASGIAKWYTPEELVGRRVIVVANLKPATLCGEQSCGMILAADCAEDDVKVLFIDNVPAGSKIR